MPTYPGRELIESKKWMAEKKSPVANFGAGVGAGIQAGAQSAMNAVAASQKATNDYINKIFDDNMFVRVKDPNAATWQEKYEFVSVNELPQIRQALLTGSPIPQDIVRIPKQSMNTSTPETVEVMPTKENIPTLKKYMSGYTWQEGVNVSVPKTVYQQFQASLRAENKPQTPQDTARAGKTEADIINTIEDNARQSAADRKNTLKSGVLPYDGMPGPVKGQIDNLITAIEKLKAYSAQKREPQDKAGIIQAAQRSYQYLKNTTLGSGKKSVTGQQLIAPFAEDFKMLEQLTNAGAPAAQPARSPAPVNPPAAPVPAGRVVVVGPDGKQYSLPQEQLAEAQKQGYKLVE